MSQVSTRICTSSGSARTISKEAFPNLRLERIRHSSTPQYNRKNCSLKWAANVLWPKRKKSRCPNRMVSPSSIPVSRSPPHDFKALRCTQERLLNWPTFTAETETEIEDSSSHCKARTVQGHKLLSTSAGLLPPTFWISKSYLPPCCTFHRTDPEKFSEYQTSQNNEEVNNSFGNWKIIHKPKNNLNL